MMSLAKIVSETERVFHLIINMCRNRSEKYRFWGNSTHMTANTSASPKAVVVASMLY